MFLVLPASFNLFYICLPVMLMHVYPALLASPALRSILLPTFLVHVSPCITILSPSSKPKTNSEWTQLPLKTDQFLMQKGLTGVEDGEESIGKKAAQENDTLMGSSLPQVRRKIIHEQKSGIKMMVQKAIH